MRVRTRCRVRPSLAWTITPPSSKSRRQTRTCRRLPTPELGTIWGGAFSMLCNAYESSTETKRIRLERKTGLIDPRRTRTPTLVRPAPPESGRRLITQARHPRGVTRADAPLLMRVRNDGGKIIRYDHRFERTDIGAAGISGWDKPDPGLGRRSNQARDLAVHFTRRTMAKRP
jgi:hypothetical protein